MRLQIALRAIYPPECLGCGAAVESEFALCGPCWAEVPFIPGAACDRCGASLPGQADPAQRLLCDECLTIARPWSRGRAVMEYAGLARRLVLGLKHGDRADIARAVGPWMARAGADLIAPDTVIVPVPLHRIRLLRRRYNQSALLAKSLSAITGSATLLDGLTRHRATPSLDGRSRPERFAALQDSIRAHPRRQADLAGKPVLLIDDVMTTGATLATAAEALRAAGVENICVMTLARVSKAA